MNFRVLSRSLSDHPNSFQRDRNLTMANLADLSSPNTIIERMLSVGLFDAETLSKARHVAETASNLFSAGRLPESPIHAFWSATNPYRRWMCPFRRRW